jgi:hypothetical protein
MKYILCLAAFMAVFFPSRARQRVGHQTKILLIPLDDRPPCLQFTERIAMIANAQIISPPREMLGRYTDPGKSEEIVKWLKGLDLKSFDAAIISMDMLAYGGLVASREYQVTEQTALKRLEVLRELKRKSPGLIIYAQSVIMRIAPTGGGKYEAYRSQLAEWGVVSVGKDEASRSKTKSLEQEIPAGMLSDYMQARKRDLAVDLYAVNLAKEGVIDYLLVSQDDAHPQGVHVADREKIISHVKETGTGGKISVQPGADEVSMLLLARVLNDKYQYFPTVQVEYSSQKMSREVMPFEDKPLSVTVGDQISSTGAREADEGSTPDILFFVFTSRFEPGAADRFAAEIAGKIKEGKQVMVADIDPKGDVQGGDSAFATSLEKRGVLPRLNSYASWNTAGNTIGTSLSQGIVYSLARARLIGSSSARGSMLTAQQWFTFHRMLDDFYYHTLVRGKIKGLWKEGKLTGPGHQPDMKQVLAFSRGLMGKYFDSLRENYFGKNGARVAEGLSCTGPRNLRFSFPWNRIFEAEISFDLQCTPVKN